MYRVLVVEDNDKIRLELCDFLSKNGYAADSCTNFEHIKEEIKAKRPDLILLDLGLPFMDGHFICKELRRTSNVPIIIVTSRNSEMDELLSMNLGADDYVTKPYNLQILLARISRVLRRVYEAADSSIMRLGEVIMDVSKSSITCRGKSVDLTKNELRIMHCLFQNRNTIVSREKLMQHMWDCDVFVDDNTLTVNINRLRKKLEYVGLSDFIETRRGQGYIVYENQ